MNATNSNLNQRIPEKLLVYILIFKNLSQHVNLKKEEEITLIIILSSN